MKNNQSVFNICSVDITSYQIGDSIILLLQVKKQAQRGKVTFINLTGG